MKVDEFYVDYATGKTWQVLSCDGEYVKLCRHIDGMFRLIDYISFKQKFTYSKVQTEAYYDHYNMLIDNTIVVGALTNHMLNHYKDVYASKTDYYMGLYVDHIGCFAEVYPTRIRFINNALSSPLIEYHGDQIPLNTTFKIVCKDDLLRAKALLQIAYRWIKSRRG